MQANHGPGAAIRAARRALLPIALLAGTSAAPAQRGEAPVRDRIAFAPTAGTVVPLDLPFVADDGSATDLRTCADGRPTVLALVYYRCPMLCNLVVDGLVSALRHVPLAPDEDYEVVLVSIDPRETSADGRRRRALLQERTKGSQGGAGWSLLTGAEPQIRALADAVGYGYAYDPESGEYAHAAGILVLDARGAVRQFFGGVEYPPRQLRLGLVDGSDGASGTFIDDLLLLCFHYDPTTGRYGFAILTAVRVLGVLTLLAIGGGIAFHVRRERRRRAQSSSS